MCPAGLKLWHLRSGSPPRDRHMVPLPAGRQHGTTLASRNLHKHAVALARSTQSFAAIRAWSAVLPVSVFGRQARACECVRAANRVGQPVLSGHLPHKLRRCVAGHPGRGDEQRARRSSAQHRHGVASRPEGGLGHADHRDPELSVRVRTKAGPAAGVKVGVTVDHQKAQTAQPLRTVRIGGSSRR
jgi:hypothetical protein